MKKIITTLILVSVFCSMLNKVYAETYYSPKGNKVTIHNGYSLVTNKKNNLYEFYLDYLGDWAIIVDNEEKLNNIEKTYKELGEYKVKNFEISNIYQNSNGNKIIELNDYSSIIINESNNLYEFYPTELGDWNISANNKNELKNIVITYMEYKYNIYNESILGEI